MRRRSQNCPALLGSHCSRRTMDGSLFAPLMNSSRDSLPMIKHNDKFTKMEKVLSGQTISDSGLHCDKWYQSAGGTAVSLVSWQTRGAFVQTLLPQ